MQLEKYKVNSYRWELLKLGDLAIRYAKGILPYAGNVASDIKETQGGSFQEWMKLRRRIPGSYSPRKTVRYIIDQSDYESGSCGEYADLVYVFLREQASAAITITYYVLKSDDHAFVGIGDGRNQVIVDAWPPRAQALLFEHYIHSTNFDDWLVFYQKPGKNRFGRQIEKQYSYSDLRKSGEVAKTINKNILRSLDRFLENYPDVYGINGEKIYKVETLAINGAGYDYRVGSNRRCAMF